MLKQCQKKGGRVAAVGIHRETHQYPYVQSAHTHNRTYTHRFQRSTARLR